MKIYFKLFLMMISGLFVSCAGEGYNDPQGSMGWGHMMNYRFGYGGMFMWILILIVIGAVIYFFVQAQKTKSQTQIQDESHLDLLKKRYAKGEIAKEEYERIKKDLEG